jgi:hypothetical protein
MVLWENVRRFTRWLKKGLFALIGSRGPRVKGFLKRMFWVGLAHPDGNAKPVIRETAGLFTIVMTAGAGLILGQVDTNRPICLFIGLFALVAFAALFGMEAMIMAQTTSSNDQTPRHAYDWASVRFTQCTFIISLVIAGGLVYFAFAGRLPYQAFNAEKKAELGEPYRHEFKDKTAGLILPVKLNQSLYPKGIPPKLLMVITLKDELAKDWLVVGVEGKVGPPTEQTAMDPEPVPYESKLPPNRAVWYLNGLKADRPYTIEVYFHQRDGDARVPYFLKSIQARGVAVSFFSREK